MYICVCGFEVSILIFYIYLCIEPFLLYILALAFPQAIKNISNHNF